MFALRTLRAHGMVDNILHDVTKATLVAQLTYAAPAWWGFLSAALCHKEDSANWLSSFFLL